MGGPDDAKIPSREEIEKSLADILKNNFKNILDADDKLDIQIALNRLCNSIYMIRKHGFTTSSYLEMNSPAIGILVGQLLIDSSPEARAKTLLAALADKDKFGLEEKFLEKLREIK